MVGLWATSGQTASQRSTRQSVILPHLVVCRACVLSRHPLIHSLSWLWPTLEKVYDLLVVTAKWQLFGQREFDDIVSRP